MLTGVVGCAGMQFPRIDPTGESFFLQPGELPPGTVGAPIASTGPTPSMVPPTFAPNPSVAAGPTIGPPGPIIGPPAPAPKKKGLLADCNLMQKLGLSSKPVVSNGVKRVDHLVMTPQRLLAPVGSEVILRAGICTEDGHLISSQKVEWILAGEGVGAFVAVGEPSWADPFTKPKKIDNHYAIGRTSCKKLNLDRGTPDPSDDIPVRDGETWISVTSPIEGTSLVTAMAPGVKDWNRRRLTATIHWIDAQWVFPQPVSLNKGGSHVLTTLLARRADRSPIIGWQVRYEILDKGAATFGQNGADIMVVNSDEAGRASIEIFPAAGSSTTARVAIQIIRPPLPGSPNPIPLGNGATSVTWSSPDIALQAYGPASAAVGSTVRYQFQVSNPGASLAQDVRVTADVPSGLSFLQSNPPTNASTGRTEWAIGDLRPGENRTIAADYRVESSGNIQMSSQVTTSNGLRADATTSTQIAASQAALDVQVLGPAMAQVGGTVTFNVVITNRGTTAANNIVIVDRFAQGMGHDKDPNRTLKIETPPLGDLLPGESTDPIELTFNVLEAGRLCHTVEVTADGVSPVSQKKCVDAVPATSGGPPINPGSTPPVRPSSNANLFIESIAPRRSYVGKLELFKIIVKNTGQVALQNVLVEEVYSQQLAPKQADEGYKKNQNKLSWIIPNLPAGEQRVFQIEYQCIAPTNTRGACTKATASVPNMVRESEGCVEILPAASAGAGTPSTAQPGLTFSLSTLAVRPRERTQGIYTVTIINQGQQSDKNVQLEVFFPPELTPDVARINQSLQARGLQAAIRGNNAIVLTQIKEIRSLETINLTLFFNANRAGNVKLQARLSSTGLTQPIVSEQAIEILPQ